MVMIRKLMSSWMVTLLTMLLLPLVSVLAVSSTTYDTPYPVTTSIGDTAAHAATATPIDFAEPDLQTMSSGPIRTLFGPIHGFLAGKSSAELRKGMTSLKKQLTEHRAKIADPESAIPRFKQLDPRQQKALLETKWPGDIQRQQEQISILKSLLGED